MHDKQYEMIHSSIDRWQTKQIPSNLELIEFT